MNIYNLNKYEYSKKQMLFLVFTNMAIMLSIKPFIGKNNINYFAIIILLFIVIYDNILLGNIITNKYSKYYYLFILSFLIFNIFNIKSFKISSFTYSILFITAFEIYKKYLKNNDNYNLIKWIFKIIYYLYTIILFLQYIYVKLDITYIPNAISFDRNNIRLNGFATEPSYAGIIIIVLYYINNITFKEKKYNIFKNKNDFKSFIILIINLYIINAGFGYFCFLLLIFFTIFRNIKIKNIYLYVLIILIVIYIMRTNIIKDNVSINRLFNMIKFLPDIINDYSLVLKIDHSAAMRIAPNLIYLDMIKNLNYNIFIGYGMNYSEELMANILPGIEQALRGGFLPGYLINNGLITSVLFIIYLYKNIFSNKIILSEKCFQILLIILTFLNSNFNTSIFWSIIILFYTNNYYKYKNNLKRSDNENLH